MNDTPSLGSTRYDSSLSADDLAQIVQACDQFEAAWRQGLRPRIQDRINRAPDRLHAHLLRELISLRAELLQLDGHPPADPRPQPRQTSEDHLDRTELIFPGGTPVVPGAEPAGDVRCCGEASTLPDESLLSSRPFASHGRTDPYHDAPRFRILRSHDRGGLGELFIARDDQLRREVALKQILPEAAHDHRRLSRFFVEAEITGRLEHPGIVPVYAFGFLDDGRPFYAMRFIRGESLKTAITGLHARPAPREIASPSSSIREQLRAESLRKLLLRLIDVCNTMAYAHSRGVLHRDLKPSNIMLGPYGETLVVDWGLAKAAGQSFERQSPHYDLAYLSSSPLVNTDPVLVPESGSDVHLTETGDCVGTPHYMSPEQAAGRWDDLGPAADIYSLGATLYCILTGRPPFQGQDIPQLLRQVQAGEFPLPCTLNPAIKPPLQAICLKAMALRPQDRYESALDLASDLDLYLQGEPLSAYPEPFGQRTSRWIKRNRTALTALAMASLLLFSGLLYYGYELDIRSRQRYIEANSRVDALLTAETRSLPLIIEQLEPDLRLVLPRLEAIAAQPLNTPGRLGALLTLLPRSLDSIDLLRDRLLQNEIEITPDEVLVVRNALQGYGYLRAISLDDLVKKKTDPPSAPQLRALAMLAASEPDHPDWPARARWSVPTLVAQNPMWLSTWATLFRPVAAELLAPMLEVHREHPEPATRNQAFTFLIALATRPHNPRAAEDLIELAMAADPNQLDQILRHLHNPPSRARAIEILEARLEPLAHLNLALAEEQAHAAVVLLHLNAPDRVWPLFRHALDPTVRTHLVNSLAAYRVDPLLLTHRLASETETSARRALLLALGEFPTSSISESDRDSLIPTLLDWYRADPDPGIHGSVDWLLRQRWGLAAQLDLIDQDLASTELPSERDWFTNGQRQTFTLFRGPITFRMGRSLLPEDESEFIRDLHQELSVNVTPHDRVIPRSFALASRELSMADYEPFLDQKPPGVEDHRMHRHFRYYVSGPDHAVVDVTWLEAAAYCNWLSAREGIPRDQWCFPEPIGHDMVLPDDYLERTGYRLPTEAEWEYAARAEAVTRQFFGASTRQATAYCWVEQNGGGRPQPSGRLKPNDAGLFDMLGNVIEHCSDYALDPLADYPLASASSRIIDAPNPPGDFQRGSVRRVRGSSFTTSSTHLRVESRSAYFLTPSQSSLGVRLARTLPPSSKVPAEESPKKNLQEKQQEAAPSSR